MHNDWTKDVVTVAEVLQSLGLSENDLNPDIGPIQVNTGNSFMVVGVKDEDEDEMTLRNLKPNFDHITAISKNLI